MAWRMMTKKLPPEGFTAVVALDTGGHISYETGTFCDGEWYKLTYDKVLGVLRKDHIDGEPVAYTPILVPKYPMTDENV